MSAVALFLLAVCEPLVGPESAGPAATSPLARRIETVIVRREQAPDDALLDALRTRLPDVQFLTFASESFAAIDNPDALAFVDIAAQGDALRLTIILHDGRAYEREMPAPKLEVERALARVTAATLAAIEEQRIAPTRTGAAIPLPEPQPVTEPEPAQPSEPAARKPQPSPDEQPPAPVRDRDLAGFVGGLLTAGLGLPGSTGLSAGGGLVGASFRHKLWTAALHLRLAGRAREGDGLLRARVGAGGGVVPRLGRWRLPVVAFASVEPWRTTTGALTVRPRPLLGGGISFSPSLRVADRKHTQLHVGVRAELAGSVLPDGNAARVSRADAQVFELGGLEASIGVVFALIGGLAAD